MVLDGPDSWAQTMAAEGLIEKFVGLDFADADTVYNRCVDAIQAIKKVPDRRSELAHPPSSTDTPNARNCAGAGNSIQRGAYIFESVRQTMSLRSVSTLLCCSEAGALLLGPVRPLGQSCCPWVSTCASSACHRWLQDFGELDGMCTFSEMAVPLVSRLTERFGLPGNTPAAVDAARSTLRLSRELTAGHGYC